MAQPARDLYIESFIRRSQVGVEPSAIVQAVGVHGVLPSSQTPMGRLLVVDDAAEEFLQGQAAELLRCSVIVLGEAPRCVKVLADLQFAREDGRAMVCRDASTVPDLPLPPGLDVQRVHRVPTDPPGVPLEAATEACTAADPAQGITGQQLAGFLSTRVPASTQLFAAVDETGAVRATSGCFVAGAECGVLFVSTAADSRGHGVGTAMTALAIRAGVAAGARRACLEASDAGRRIYNRLGFEDAGPIIRFISL